MQPNISVIIPIYNVERYLKKSINSVLNQTLKNIEVILVNDGSTDESGRIIDQYAKKDSRVKVIHQKNQGVSTARNEGLALAKGEYIGFVDPDDWIELDMYERLYLDGIKNDCDIVVSNFMAEVINGQSLRSYKHPFKSNSLMESNEIKDQICKQLLIGGFFTSVWDKIYRRSFLEENEIKFFIDIKLREDYFFNIDIFNCSKRVFYNPKQLYNYQDNPGSSLKRYHENAFDISVELYEYKTKHSEIWSINSREIKYKMACDFLNEVQDTIKHVFDFRNSDNFINKIEKISSIVNNPIVQKSFVDFKYENMKNEVGTVEGIMIKLVNRKSVILLSIISFNISITPKNFKKKLKSILIKSLYYIKSIKHFLKEWNYGRA